MIEKRKDPRLELYASVRLERAGERLLLPVKNISLGGVLLATDGNDLSTFPVGTKHQIVVFHPDDPGKNATVKAEVVRHDEAGMALSWPSELARATIALLLESLPPRA
jgi:hypothetical protein